jgi:hypothetical protein
MTERIVLVISRCTNGLCCYLNSLHHAKHRNPRSIIVGVSAKLYEIIYMTPSALDCGVCFD